MSGESKPSFGKVEAQQLADAGWRQGSPFRPPPGFQIPIEFDCEVEWLVVCTQSCSVVSERFKNDPFIEMITATIVPIYKATSPEASGKNLRCFHLPITGLPDFQALACDINRRVFLRRELFLAHTPTTGVQVAERDTTNLAGWISRYYTRIALPSELVSRAKLGLFESIRSALKSKMATGNSVFDSIKGIYIGWEPISDILTSDSYKLDMLFLCENEEADTTSGSFLADELASFTEAGGQDGIKLKYESKLLRYGGKYPQLRKYAERVAQRPSVVATFPPD